MDYWHRCTPNLQKAMLAAQRCARELHARVIEPGHLVLGLLTVADCGGVALLHQIGIDADGLYRALRAALSRDADRLPHAHDPATILLSPASERALQSTYLEARKDCARQNRPFSDGTPVRTTHLLLGITSPASSVQVPELRAHGVFYAELSDRARQQDEQRGV